LKQATLIFALLGAIVLAGCGGNGDTTSQTDYNNGSGDQPFKPTTHLSHRSVVSNSYAGSLQVVDATQDRLTTYTFAIGAKPTYIQSSPDGLYTFVNNTGSNSISTLDNNQEKIRATIQLGGATLGFATSKSNQIGFAAVPGYSNGNPPILPGAITRFNPYNGSLNTAIPFPYATYLVMDPAEKHLLIFTAGDSATPNGDDNAYWVDLTTNDPNTGFPAISVLTLPAGALSKPVAAFFSADSSTAYILNCGIECGGSASASVTEISAIAGATTLTTASQASGYLPGIYVGTATVVNQWTGATFGARRGLIDLTASKLYVAGSTGATLVDSGGNTVQDGYFTAIDLAAGTAAAPIRIGNGAKNVIRRVSGNFWVGSSNCGVQSCVSIVTAGTTPSALPIARGNATGIALQPNTGETYTIEGGQLYIYDKNLNPVTSQYNTDIRGQGYDVMYID